MQRTTGGVGTRHGSWRAGGLLAVVALACSGGGPAPLADDAGAPVGQPDAPTSVDIPAACADQPGAWPAPAPAPTPTAYLTAFPSALVTLTEATGSVSVINSSLITIGPVWFEAGMDGVAADIPPTPVTLTPYQEVRIPIRVDAFAPGPRRAFIAAHTDTERLEIEVRSATPGPVPGAREYWIGAPSDALRDPLHNPTPIVPVNTVAVLTVHNGRTDGMMARLSPPTASGPWQLVGTTCGATLAPGATCTVSVRPLAVSTTTVAMGLVTLDLAADVWMPRTITIAGPARVRSRAGHIDCQGPGTCVVGSPRSLCHDLVASPAAGHNVTVEYDCAASTDHHVTATASADADIVWSLPTGDVVDVAIEPGGRVAAVTRGDWNSDALPESDPDAPPPRMLILEGGVEVARRDFTARGSTAVSDRGGAGFALARVEAGRAWVEALDRAGTALWRRDVGPSELVDVWGGPGGQVYVKTWSPPSQHRDLTAYSADGALAWRRDLDDVTAVLGADGLGLGVFDYAAPGTLERWAPNGGVTVTALPAVASVCGPEAVPAALLRDGGYLLKTAPFTSCTGYHAFTAAGAARGTHISALTNDGLQFVMPRCQAFTVFYPAAQDPDTTAVEFYGDPIDTPVERTLRSLGLGTPFAQSAQPTFGGSLGPYVVLGGYRLITVMRH